ncbi:MAG: ribonuclease P protein component [Patescibacteria group bacterium]
MLPKKNRVNTKNVEKIFKEGFFVNSQNLTFKFIKVFGKSDLSGTTGSLTYPKTGTITQISFIVPKTVSKKAVIRNLLRRRGYNILEKYFSNIPPLLGVIIFGKKSLQFFAGKKSFQKNSFQNLENEIKIVLNKV